MKPFDDKFADNVREVFDNYQEPVDENAWMQMKGRLQKKPRIIIFSPGWVKAAATIAVLIVSSVFFWQIFTTSPLKDTGLTAESTAIDETQTLPVSPVESISEVEAASDTPSAQFIEGIKPESVSVIAEAEIPTDRYGLPRIPLEDQQEDKMMEDSYIAVAAEKLTETDRDTLAVEPVRDLIAQSEVVPGIDSPAVRTGPTDEEIIRENLAWMEPVGRDRGTGLEVAAGSMKTWSPNEIAGGIGFSAGVTGSWDLSNRLSLATGGLLVYNQFNLDDATTTMTRSKLDHDYTSSIVGANSILSLQGQTSAEFEFLAIDVPLNFRYKITETNAGKWYISAGLSSLIYLQQNYTQRTDLSAMYTGESFQGYRTVNITETSAGNVDAFRRVDVARLLNLSAGYALRRDNFAMVIEPYVKLPLADVTSLDLNIGMIGVNLKYQLGR